MNKALSLQEVELLASLLVRAGLTQIEALWANQVFDKLRVIAAEMESPPQDPPGEP